MPHYHATILDSRYRTIIGNTLVTSRSSTNSPMKNAKTNVTNLTNYRYRREPIPQLNTILISLCDVCQIPHYHEHYSHNKQILIQCTKTKLQNQHNQFRKLNKRPVPLEAENAIEHLPKENFCNNCQIPHCTAPLQKSRYRTVITDTLITSRSSTNGPIQMSQT